MLYVPVMKQTFRLQFAEVFVRLAAKSKLAMLLFRLLILLPMSLCFRQRFLFLVGRTMPFFKFIFKK